MMLLTTESAIVEKKKDDNMNMPAGMGMPNMMFG